MSDSMWRVEMVVWAAPLNEYDEPSGPGRTSVRAVEYAVVKRTPKGVRLNIDNKFVSSTARRRWACPTVEEAVESFLARKAREASILKARLKRIEEAVALAKSGQIESVSLKGW